MNKKEKIAVAIILASVVILNGYSNSKLKQEIRLLQNEISNVNSNFFNNFNDLSYNMTEFQDEIRRELEKQSSILSSNNIDVEYKEGKLQVNLSVVPMEFTEEEKVKFIVGGEEVAATNEGGAFTAKLITAPRDVVEARVQFIDGDTVRQEELKSFNIKEELAINTNVFFGDSFQELKDKKSEYKDTLVLSCYNPNGKVKVKNPKEITLIVKDINKEEIIAEIPMENPPKEIIDVPKLEPHDAGTSFHSVDISDIMKLEGQYVLYCNLVTENGLKYYFPIGEIDSSGDVRYDSWGANSGPIYPYFD